VQWLEPPVGFSSSQWNSQSTKALSGVGVRARDRTISLKATMCGSIDRVGLVGVRSDQEHQVAAALADAPPSQLDEEKQRQNVVGM
jgi:hypothetical protein